MPLKLRQKALVVQNCGSSDMIGRIVMVSLNMLGGTINYPL